MPRSAANSRKQQGSAARIALTALVGAVERRVRAHALHPPPDAFLLGNYRHTVVAALQKGLLSYVAVVDWPTFNRLSSLPARQGLDGLRTAVALSLPEAQTSGLCGEIIAALERPPAPRPPSVLFGRLTRPTCGQIIFRSQFLVMTEGEFGSTPLEMASMLERHTPAAIRAMLHGRLIRCRPDLDSDARQALVWHTSRHLGRLLSDADALRHTLQLLRLTYYRLHHPLMARPVLRRVRVVDFSARRTAAVDDQARPRR